jgi:hypothetical protein
MKTFHFERGVVHCWKRNGDRVCLLEAGHKAPCDFKAVEDGLHIVFRDPAVKESLYDRLGKRQPEKHPSTFYEKITDFLKRRGR